MLVFCFVLLRQSHFVAMADLAEWPPYLFYSADFDGHIILMNFIKQKICSNCSLLILLESTEFAFGSLGFFDA